MYKGTIVLVLAIVYLSLAGFVPQLGVCYYPEQWSPSLWESDARRMKELGIEHVRIGEFMWAIIEPQENKFNWTIIDTTLDILTKYGLKAIIGTPTATPPKWLIDKYGGDDSSSEILPFDINGKPRKFGSRRHYRFSSPVYRKQVLRIASELVNRYGSHPAVSGWQLDNEYGCHDTVRSYDTMDSLPRFRVFLKEKFNNSISALNEAWGNSFWSMNYNNFSSIDLPNMAVTESNPAHWLEFYRYSSNEVAEFNKLTFDVIKSKIAKTDRFITTNFMGFFFDFDHFDTAEHLDIASWDSYPLGFTDTSGHIFSKDEQIRYARTGHPDVAAFHHDLYSSVSGQGLTRKPFMVMEQQPGPVNWAYHNPSPAPGQIRLWTWEAIAHGASMVSYFRWRQANFAQEQMHAGLNRPDNQPDIAFFEGKQAKQEIEKLENLLSSQAIPKAPIALIFDYQGQWVSQIQPQGQEFNYVTLVYYFYSEARKLGFDIDILRPGADLTGYKLVLVPSLPIITELALKSFQDYLSREPAGKIVFGPRSGSKTENTFQIPATLAPGKLQQGILPGLKIIRVETFAPQAPENGFVTIHSDFKTNYSVWKEWVEISSFASSEYQVTANFTYGEAVERPACVAYQNRVHYMAVFPNRQLLSKYLADITGAKPLPFEGLRMRRARENLTFLFNFDAETRDVTSIIPQEAQIVLGSADKKIGPSDLIAWTI